MLHCLQERTAGSKGCPRIQADKTLLVPAQISTNITVPAQDLPPVKVLLQNYLFLTFLGSHSSDFAMTRAACILA